MDITVKTSELMDVLDSVVRIAGRKMTIPILGNVLVTATAEATTLEVTDIDVSLRLRCPASVTVPGKALLPATKLREIMRALPGADVRIRVEGKTAQIDADPYHGRLQAPPVDQFPVLAEPEGESVSLPKHVLLSMLQRTRFAITETTQRYFMSGACLWVDDGKAKVGTTDGHRMALCTVTGTEKEPLAGALKPVLISRKSVDELPSMLDGLGDVTIHVGVNNIYFSCDGRLLISRRIEEKEPAYERVIPKENKHTVSVVRQTFASVMRRVAITASKETGKIKLSIDSGGITVSAESVEWGESSERYEAKYEDAPVEFYVKAQYLLDFFDAAVTNESVLMEFKNSMTPAILRGLPLDATIAPLVVVTPIRPPIEDEKKADGGDESKSEKPKKSSGKKKAKETA